MEMISTRRDVNAPTKKLGPDLKEEVQNVIMQVRPKMLELLEPLLPMAEEFAGGLAEGIQEWIEENAQMEEEAFPALRKEIFQLSGDPKALKKRALLTSSPRHRSHYYAWPRHCSYY
jgi:hypothetical protein